MNEMISFEESLEDDDWGLIIGKDGSLKGLFVPDGEDEDLVPEVIVKLCKEHWGIDVTSEGETLH